MDYMKKLKAAVMQHNSVKMHNEPWIGAREPIDSTGFQILTLAGFSGLVWA